MGTHFSYQLGCLSRTSLVVVTLLEVSEKAKGVVALHLPIGPLKTRSELEPVPRCEPSTYQPIRYCAIGADIDTITLCLRPLTKRCWLPVNA